MSMGGAEISSALFGIILFGYYGIASDRRLYLSNLKNATSKDRFSAFDITDSTEETDPLNEYSRENNPSRKMRFGMTGLAPTAARTTQKR